MNKLIVYIRNNYSEIYKGFLFVLITALLVTMFPREGKFKYEFQKGKPWMHEDLIAPFNFAIQKSKKELKEEMAAALEDFKPYFTYRDQIYQEHYSDLINDFEDSWQNAYGKADTLPEFKHYNRKVAVSIFDTLFSRGIIELSPVIENKPDDYEVMQIQNKVAEERELGSFFTISEADRYIRNRLQQDSVNSLVLLPVLKNSLEQNVIFDAEKTQREKEAVLEKISPVRGMVQKGERIISRGELVTQERYQILQSLQEEYKEQVGSLTNYNLILLGQIMLVAFSIIVLALFLYYFKPDIYEENKKIVMILITIFLLVFITSLTMRYNVDLIYLVPMCLVPIIIRVFFDTRTALLVHLVTIIITGFLVPNSFEFVFLQLIAGIITIISVVKMQKRAQFFLTSVLIFITYSAIHIGLSLIQGGGLQDLDPMNFALFGGSAILTLFSYPLIFIFEKSFGFVTDVTLMELSDTNSNLLRELAMKAPGTFQHSIQVANIAEEAIYEIGGNALLVRTGALYHDIGKMDQPMYFIENQSTGVNPHDELTYEESAQIIISHVIKGVEKAKKRNLPEQLIDFIRTHHGTTKAFYFYNKQLSDYPEEEVDVRTFTYHGPIPFSRETAVLMMADSVEAASRSLKSPNEENISNLVENVIKRLVDLGQFQNSDITMRDITRVKKIVKHKLMNIYHLRIEYPE
ncbi:MAG: HDIG domain-containing protein [Bacteroidales bacterium]|nr:HDIG domain-containing protein [Bacteroidales bacterium]